MTGQSVQMGGLDREPMGASTARSRLEAMGDQFSRSIEHMQMAMPLLLEFYGVAAREPSVRKFLTEAYQDLHDVLTGLLEQGVTLTTADPDPGRPRLGSHCTGPWCRRVGAAPCASERARRQRFARH